MNLNNNILALVGKANKQNMYLMPSSMQQTEEVLQFYMLNYELW
jgi:hypothetical protein